jgi:hypothetical protein
MSSGGSGIPWFKIALITAITGVSCLAAGYAAMSLFAKESEGVNDESQAGLKGSL